MQAALATLTPLQVCRPTSDGRPGATAKSAEAHAAWRAALDGGSPQAAALAWWGLARVAQPRHRDVALGRYLRAIEEVERMRPEGDIGDAAKWAFDRRYSELYREYAALLMDMGLYAEAHRAALLLQRRELIEHQWLGTRGSEGALLSGGPTAAEEPLAACPDELAEERRVAELARRLAGLRSASARSMLPRRRGGRSCMHRG